MSTTISRTTSPHRHLERRSGPLEGRLRRQAHGHRHRPRRVHRASRARSRSARTSSTAKAYGTVKAESVDTNEPQRDDHLRSADFFDAAQFPEISFESTSIEALDDEEFRITGKLTMHGVTNEIVLHADVQGTDIDPWGNERVGLEITGQLSRGDYGMKFNQALGSGNMLVADKVKLALDISAVRQAA